MMQEDEKSGLYDETLEESAENWVLRSMVINGQIMMILWVIIMVHILLVPNGWNKECILKKMLEKFGMQVKNIGKQVENP